MLGHKIHVVGALFEHSLRPTYVVSVLAIAKAILGSEIAGSDEYHLGIDFAHGLGYQVVLLHVLLERKVAELEKQLASSK